MVDRKEWEDILMKVPYPWNVADVLTDVAKKQYGEDQYTSFLPSMVDSVIRERLSERYAHIFRQRYERKLALEKIAREDGVTKQRIYDILRRAEARVFRPHSLMDYAAYPYKKYKAERDRREKLEAIVNDLSKAVGEKLEYVGNTGEKTPIEDLQLSVRSYNCLRIAKLYYAEDVAKISAARLRRIRNLGQKSIDEIVKRLNERGFSMKSEEEGNR